MDGSQRSGVEAKLKLARTVLASRGKKSPSTLLAAAHILATYGNDADAATAMMIRREAAKITLDLQRAEVVSEVRAHSSISHNVPPDALRTTGLTMLGAVMLIMLIMADPVAKVASYMHEASACIGISCVRGIDR